MQLEPDVLNRLACASRGHDLLISGHRQMPSLGPKRRKGDNASGIISGYRCAHCGEGLHLMRRHVSPVRLGARLATEFYQCRACDSGYALNPATGKWKPWVTDGDS